MAAARTPKRPRRAGAATASTQPVATVRPEPLADIARAVMSIPTAPYREADVRAHLRAFAEARALDHHEDAYGNVYLEYRRGRRRRPLVLGAHIDHPGFSVDGVRGRRLALRFHGGISAEYGRGEPLRLYREGASRAHARARITSVERDERGRLAGARATLERPGGVEAGDLALWDVVPFRVEGQRIRARACDDLAGCASILATLDRLTIERPNAHVIGLFTRAEEVGLQGASVAARDRLLPDDALVVAVETSSLAGGRAEQGAGPIVRIGDAVHIFSPGMSRWMTALAQQLVGDGDLDGYQRRLMDGGVTEATAYDLYGYETGAACIALGNYHNAGPRGRVAAETVHLGDLEGLTRLFVRMAEDPRGFERALPGLRRRYDVIGREAKRALRANGGTDAKR